MPGSQEGVDAPQRAGGGGKRNIINRISLKGGRLARGEENGGVQNKG